MRIYDALVIGGGAAGAAGGILLARRGLSVLVLEKNDRLGRKLAATGNGQGNVTNTNIDVSRYHGALELASSVLGRYGYAACRAFYESVGCLLAEGREGRVYPASFQAASVADNLRFALSGAGAEVATSCEALSLSFSDGIFCAETARGRFFARTVLAAFGGAAGAAYGTDGSSFHLMRELGHSVVPFRPSLVRLTTDRAFLKGLKGVKADAVVRVVRGGGTTAEARGDVLFADYGVSGNAVFAVSGYALEKGACLSLEFLPDVSEGELRAALANKADIFPDIRAEEIFCGILPRGVGRSLLRLAGIPFDLPAREIAARTGEIARMAKDVRLAVEGSAGLKDAQVSKGGIPGSEISADMESKILPGLFFAGEMTDVDGDCGGFNLHWAFASASAAAEAMARRLKG